MSSLQQKCEKILKTEGPKLSGELAHILFSNKKTQTLQAARQAVSRLRHPIKKITDIAFTDNQHFLYHHEDENSSKYHQPLIDYLIKHNTAAGRAISALSTKGQVETKDFPILSGAPYSKIGKNLTNARVYNQLKRHNCIEEINLPNSTKLIKVITENQPSAFSYQVTVALEKLLLDCCVDWAIRIGLASSGNTRLKTNPNIPLPHFGFFNWDFTSTTYLNSLKSYKNKKIIQGAFLVDIMLSSAPLTKSALSAYTYKVQVLQQQKKLPNFIPAIIHQGLDRDALMYLRELGVMCLEPKSFGDKKLGELISELIGLVNNIKTFMADQEKLDSLLKKMISNEYGRLLNLPGPLFMMTLAFLFKLNKAFVEPNKIVTSNDKKAEIDLLIIDHSKDVIAIECKGYKKGKKINLLEIEEWLSERRPRIIDWYRDVYINAGYKKLSFNFIISSTFTDDERQHLTELANKSFKQHPVKFLDIHDVIAMAKDFNQTAIIDGLKEHF